MIWEPQIHYGKDEPGMTLQWLDKSGWQNYLVDGEPVKAPVDIESLPSGEYRLQANAAALTCKKTHL